MFFFKAIVSSFKKVFLHKSTLLISLSLLEDLVIVHADVTFLFFQQRNFLSCQTKKKFSLCKMRQTHLEGKKRTTPQLLVLEKTLMQIEILQIMLMELWTFSLFSLPSALLLLYAPPPLSTPHKGSLLRNAKMDWSTSNTAKSRLPAVLPFFCLVQPGKIGNKFCCPLVKTCAFSVWEAIRCCFPIVTSVKCQKHVSGRIAHLFLVNYYTYVERPRFLWHYQGVFSLFCASNSILIRCSLICTTYF